MARYRESDDHVFCPVRRCQICVKRTRRNAACRSIGRKTMQCRRTAYCASRPVCSRPASKLTGYSPAAGQYGCDSRRCIRIASDRRNDLILSADIAAGSRLISVISESCRRRIGSPENDFTATVFLEQIRCLNLARQVRFAGNDKPKNICWIDACCLRELRHSDRCLPVEKRHRDDDQGQEYEQFFHWPFKFVSTVAWQGRLLPDDVAAVILGDLCFCIYDSAYCRLFVFLS